VNAELAAGREVRVRVLPRDEAFASPDLIRTNVDLLPPDQQAHPDRPHGLGPGGPARAAGCGIAGRPKVL
jgi:hypothetical protein